nr:SDR family NAD(P)-dependent oxidoreductase [Gordonia sp. LAM0048]
MSTVVVTGGTGGLGSAVTGELLSEGWRVVVPWLASPELSRLPDSERLCTVECDLFDPHDVAKLAEAARATPDHPPSAIVNLVGGFAMGARLADVPVAEFDAMMRLNLRPTYLVTQALLPDLVRGGGGAVIGVTSAAASNPFPGGAAYATAKSAVWTLIHSIATEYRRDGIRANAISPSVIDTPGNRDSQPNADRSAWVPPSQVAKVIAFLISDASAAVTAANIPVTRVTPA